MTTRKQSKVLSLTPILSIAGNFTPPVFVNDQLISVQNNTVCLFDRFGQKNVIGATQSWPARWCTNGSTVLGWDIHGLRNWLLVDQRQQTVAAWRPPIDLPIPNVFAYEDGFIAYAQHEIVILDSKGEVLRVLAPAIAPNESMMRLRIDSLGHLIMGAFDRNASTHSHVVSADFDGTIRWRRAGSHEIVVGEHIVFFDQHSLITVDTNGQEIARTEGFYPNSTCDGGDSVVILGEDILFTANHELIRYHPREGRVIWRTSMNGSLLAPTVTKAVVAVARNPYAQDGRTVTFVEAANGRVRLQADAATAVREPVAIGDDSFVAVSYSKKQVAWRNLLAAPERVVLPHDEKVFEMVSLFDGVAVARTGNGLVWWQLGVV